MPSASGLLGVALVIRSREGPRFVFHYPQRLRDNSCNQSQYGNELAPVSPTMSEDDENDEEEDNDNDGLVEDESSGGVNDAEKSSTTDKRDRSTNLSAADHYFSEEGVQICPWEHLDAFATNDLASILTPSRAYHKKCFELSLDPVVYITYPIHIREDGNWKKPKREKRNRRKQDRLVDKKTPVAVETDGDMPRDSVRLSEKESPISEDGSDNAFITMFNIVFMMHSPPEDTRTNNQHIFEYVARDINKALKLAQHYSNYVSAQSELILSLKETAKQDRHSMDVLWRTLLIESSLATALKSVFNTISRGEVATIRLDSTPPVKLSLQIPRPFFLQMPPSNHEIAMPGVWITTANSLNELDEQGNHILSKDFALLLLEDEAQIVSDIHSDGGALAGPLLRYLKILSPTQTLQQISVQHSLSLVDIRVLAQHLIYFRRAKAIPPLHGRDIYIMNPAADNHRLPAASIEWADKFPLEPPLLTFLADLTKTLMPYKQFAPSKSHRPVYMSMLAWLMRGGWVTQLCTFAWIIVWPEIRYEVEYQLDLTRYKKAYEETVREGLEEAMLFATASDPLTTEQAAEKARVQRARGKARADWDEFLRRPVPNVTERPSCLDTTPVHISRLHALTIVDPARPSTIESLYLDAISKRMKNATSTKAFIKYAKYFNGQEALEMISVKEGLKRKEVAGLLVDFDEYLHMTRHW